MQILKNTSTDKKDIAKATTTNLAVKDFVDETVKVTGVIIYSKDNGKEEVEIYAINTEEEGWLMSNSRTVKDVVDTILVSYTDEEIRAGIDVVIKSGVSASKRTFYYLEIQ